MSDFFGISSNNSNSFFSSFFGNTSTSSTGSSLSLGDYSMIQNGSYKKLLTKYYAENPPEKSDSTNAIKTSAQADSTKQLVLVKDSASKANETASTLLDMDVDTDKKEDIMKNLKSFVDSYNTLVDNVDDLESVTILQSAVWMTNQTKANKNVLAEVGITVGTGNKLTFDETTFNKADKADLKAVLEGTSSAVGQISKKISQIYTMAGTQALVNQRTSSYNSAGGYNVMNTSQLYNSLL